MRERTRAIVVPMLVVAFCTIVEGSGRSANPLRYAVPRDSASRGALLDLGGQRLHVVCTGRGSPTVLLESGSGDFGVVWALVQPGVATFTRACSYDRGGYGQSDPGTRPRSYQQLALELRTALERLRVPPPYVLVGQSYGGLVVRGFAERYRPEIAGMVLVDAVHEDQRIVIGGQPVRIRDWAKGRPYPTPHISLDTSLLRAMHDSPSVAINESLDPDLRKLPSDAQREWQRAAARPIYRASSAAEMDWSPEELARMHEQRRANRATLGDLPLLVLARSTGGYPDGMQISADSLERERLALQTDLAKLSHKGRLIIAQHAGHNIHLDDPALVVAAIREIVDAARSAIRTPHSF